VELGVGVALLIRPSARWGAVGAVLLLAIFIAGVARAMSQGRAPDCHCFGQIHSEPAGPSTLIRNVIFAAAGVFIVGGGSGPSLSGGLGSLDGAQLALVATSTLASALAFAVAQLRMENRHLRHDVANLTGAGLKPPGLTRGTAAPEFDLEPVRGAARSLAEMLASGRSAVLVFVSTTCGPCLQMLPSLARWQQTLAETLSLVAVFSGERPDIERLCDEHELNGALAQEGDDTFKLYALRATPSAVLIDPDGLIGSSPAEGVAAIEALIRSRLAQSEPAGLAVHTAG
jgi:thiol-disulfide isomerase/thioredoxin